MHSSILYTPVLVFPAVVIRGISSRLGRSAAEEPLLSSDSLSYTHTQTRERLLLSPCQNLAESRHRAAGPWAEECNPRSSGSHNQVIC